MCLSPNRIPNPNFGNKSRYISALCDTSSMYINVPCGHCSECVAIRQMNVVQRCQMEEFNNHLFYCTLTYNNDALPVLTTSTGYDIRYADISDVQNMMKRIRRHNLFGRKFKYFGVSELGSKSARPHFHLIFSVEKYPTDDRYTIMNLEHQYFHVVLSQWKRNIGSTRNPVWKLCCTYVRKMVRGRLKSTYDFHYIDPRPSGGDTCDVPFYVTKYMLKHSDREERLQRALHLNLPEDEYESTWSLVRTRSFASIHFGYDGQENVRKYIRDCIERSKREFDSPKFYNPFSGASFPLSRYYMNIGDLYGIDDALFFNSKRNIKDNVVIDDSTYSEKLRKIEKFSKNVKLVDSHDESYIFDEILNG